MVLRWVLGCMKGWGKKIKGRARRLPLMPSVEGLLKLFGAN